ncbi:hypothetical protein [Leptospira idonii]|uniref:DUF4912 domain-containing protein n=1 Tax=Leptospira idonii TaxID=1193500 RepID=A0A4R9M0J4_9LEPT|nr:hypothetical protein [Leptospira idonii]TGN20183.1 hypothetical protein EHS15_05700 [Leptospira idonii]
MTKKENKKSSPSRKSTEPKVGSHPASSLSQADSLKKESKKKTIVPIYSNPKFSQPIPSPDRDMIKVLLRNPNEVFVFWKGNAKHFDSLREELGASSSEEVHFKLKLQYLNLIGSRQEAWYDLKPFTESYYCKFTFPVREIEANLFAVFSGKMKLFLETKSGDLPPGVESLQLDENWIHPTWIETGWVKQNKEGHFYFTDNPVPGEGFSAIRPVGSSGGSFSLPIGGM